MAKIVSVVGARPQFIKATMISKKMRAARVEEILVHTGQHYDFNMSDVFFEELDLPKPDYNLGIGSGDHGEQTGRMLIEIEKVLLKEKPDMVSVYGDTNSTIAGALAAAKLHIPVAHIEAGLRSYNKRMPEEINRILTDHIADILFVPTEVAVKNLKNEGIIKGVYDVGDVMLDIALEVAKIVNTGAVLSKFKLEHKDYILTTIHRADNTDIMENLENILEALKEISKDYKIFFPVHPRTRNALMRFNLLNDMPNNLILNEPVSYKEMIALEQGAKLIITDSGGVQKEAYFFKISCVTVREETEWTELVDAKWNKLAGVNKEGIVKSTLEELNRKKYPKWIDFYGGGRASDRIVRILINESK